MRKNTKRFLVGLLSLLMVLAMMPSLAFASAPNVARNVTTSTSYTDLNEALVACTSGQTVELLMDVDLEGETWTPVANFNGTFDGKGFTISGLKVTAASSNAGLFANTETSAVIKDLTISGATIEGGSAGTCVGVLAGSVSGSTISKVKITGCTVSANQVQYVGGLTGYGYPLASYCEVSNCNITGKDQVGGIIGYLWVGGLNNCKAENNKVTATEERAGGLIGKAQFDSGNTGGSTMGNNNNTVSGGTIKAPDYAGGFAGQIMGNCDQYTIQGNTISSVTLDAPEISPIATIRPNQDQAFLNSLTTKVSKNTWNIAEPETRRLKEKYGASDNKYNDTAMQVPVWVNAVCKIGNTKYESLQAAVTAAENDNTIVMVADETIAGNEGITVPQGKKIILDLNGKKVKNSVNESKESYVINNKGTLTIKDSTDTECEGTGTGLLTNDVAKGSQAEAWWSTNQNTYLTNVIENNGTLTILSGKIENTAKGGDCFCIDTNSIKAPGRVSTCNIKGGLIKNIACTPVRVAPVNEKKAAFTMTDGIIEGAHGILFYGNLSSAPQAEVSISGGTIKARERAFYTDAAQSITDQGNMSVSITDVLMGDGEVPGGKFLISAYPLSGFVYGGYYTKDISDYIANGYRCISNTESETKEDYPYTVGHNVVLKSYGMEVQVIEVKHGYTLSRGNIKTVSKDNFVFVGWLDKDGKQFLFDTPVTKDIILEANWLKKSDEGKITVKDTDEGIKATTDIQKSDVPMTLAETAKIADGGKLDVNLTVKAVEKKEVPKTDEELIKEEMTEEQNLGVYLDLNLVKILYDKENKEVSKESVKETLKKITITVTIPEKLRATERKYSVIRVHNNVAETLAEDLEADKNWQISFETDKFSTYALVYEGGTDSNTVTFDANGGTGTMAAITVKNGDTIKLPESTYKAPEGKKFKCWSVDGETRNAGSEIKVTKDITLKAEWETIAVTGDFSGFWICYVIAAFALCGFVYGIYKYSSGKKES